MTKNTPPIWIAMHCQLNSPHQPLEFMMLEGTQEVIDRVEMCVKFMRHPDRFMKPAPVTHASFKVDDIKSARMPELGTVIEPPQPVSAEFNGFDGLVITNGSPTKQQHPSRHTLGVVEYPPELVADAIEAQLTMQGHVLRIKRADNGLLYIKFYCGIDYAGTDPTVTHRPETRSTFEYELEEFVAALTGVS